MNQGTRARAFFVKYNLKGDQSQMDYGMIGKIEKAKRYAEQRDRIRIDNLTVTFEGENNDHTVNLDKGIWHCDCDFFQSRGRCSHTMALEKILGGMKGIPEFVT
jgi:hypothetical protein